MPKRYLPPIYFSPSLPLAAPLARSGGNPLGSLGSSGSTGDSDGPTPESQLGVSELESSETDLADSVMQIVCSAV